MAPPRATTHGSGFDCAVDRRAAGTGAAGRSSKQLVWTIRAGAVALVVLVAACGEPATELESGADGRWDAEVLGRPGEDTEALLAERDGVVVAVTAGPTFGAWWADGDSGFEAADHDGGGAGRRLLDVSAGPAGFAAAGRTDDLRPVLWVSGDGRAWREVVLDEAADAHAVGVTDDRFVAAGALRTGPDPASAPFAPVVWHSVDGERWETVRLGDGGEGHVAGMARTGTELLAVGRDDGQPVLWRSDDGVSWTKTAAPRGAQWLRSVAAREEVVVIGIDRDEPDGDISGELLRSPDGGRTWNEVDLPDALGSSLEGYEVRADDHGFSIITSDRVDVWRDPDRCYSDIESCRRPASPRVFVSKDGTSWRELDVSTLSDGDYFGLGDVSHRTSGRPVLLGIEESLTAWSWTGNGEPPSPPRRTPPPPPEEPLASHGDTLEPGVTYRFPLYTHCGITHLGPFNGSSWTLVEQRSGWEPEDGPLAQQMLFGYVTLVDDDRIEYTLAPGEVVAVYRPSAEEPPGCA